MGAVHWTNGRSRKTHRASRDCDSPVPQITTSQTVSLSDSIALDGTVPGSSKNGEATHLLARTGLVHGGGRI